MSSQKINVATLDISQKPEEEKVIIKDALIWLLAYNHLEVYRKKEFENGVMNQEYPLVIHVKGDLEELVFVNVESLKNAHAEEAAEVSQKFGIMGLVAWFAYRLGDNDVIQEMYKNEDYNKARNFLGLGSETAMESDYEPFDAEILEIIIISYNDCKCDLVRLEREYQEWAHVTDGMFDEEDEDED